MPTEFPQPEMVPVNDLLCYIKHTSTHTAEWEILGQYHTTLTHLKGCAVEIKEDNLAYASAVESILSFPHTGFMWLWPFIQF